jgi:hypothetical protein
MNEYQPQRQNIFLFFGVGIGSLVLLIPAFVLGLHNIFMRLVLMVLGGFGGLMAEEKYMAAFSMRMMTPNRILCSCN